MEQINATSLKKSSIIQLYFLSEELPYVSFLPDKLPFPGNYP